MEKELDWVALSGRRAKGKRPEYFDDPAIDRLYSIVLALVGEVSVVRERLDTIERLLDEKGTISRADIQTFKPDRAAGIERGSDTRAYISRIMRCFQQEVEALQADDPPVSEWIDRLARD